MALLLLALLALIAYVLRRRRPSPSGWAEPLLPIAPRRHRFGDLTIADVVFEYERAILGLEEVTEHTKDRAMWALSRVIVPLVGHVRLDDVNADMESGVRAVLVAQLEDEGDWLGRVWDDLIRWGRWHFTPPRERNLWHRL